MSLIHGFRKLRSKHIAELKAEASLFEHEKTGAQLLSILKDDENKVFGITFRTPPKDSTGVAHILEHSVLCGSRKYPVKEPFVELLKGSLKTFLNAFTYPDKTCYPVASQNLQDFYNLIDVYLDAVFYPRLTPAIFEQEGWHFELDRPENPLVYKGVVYNEMKGVYSSPDSILNEYSQQSLFPDNTYGLDSGGEPKQIPNLTYEEFKKFHEKHYHPSNARIYFYGDDEEEGRLRLINDYLKDFERLQVDTRIPLQPRLNAPRRIVRKFAAGKDDQKRSATRKGMITVNWLLSETTRTVDNLALHILEYILVGMPGSPLRKALIDSGLGEGMAGVGLEAELRQMFLSTGLKGIDVSDAERVEQLIFETLRELAEKGIDPETVEAAVNTIEFRLREDNTGSFPRGLVLMVRALTTWLYDSDPLSLLAFEAPLQAIKSKLKGQGYFENLIKVHLLDNLHRSTLILEPDPDLEEKEAAEERARLARIKQQMSEQDLLAIIENTQRLKRLQETPDRPEDLAKIPTLKVGDLDKKNKIIPIETLTLGDVPLLYHDLFTNRIIYLDVGLNIHRLPQEYLPYVPLFSRALVELGTDTEDFATFTQRISRKTGGIRPEFFTSAVKDGSGAAAWLFLRGKCMVEQAADMLDIYRDILFRVRLDNRERFIQMVLEEKARQEQKLVPAGHQIVNLRLRSHFSEADWAAEQMSGISYLFFVRALAERIDQNWDEVLGTLQEMHRLLVRRENVLVNVTLEREDWLKFEALAAALTSELPEGGEDGKEHASWSPEPFAPFEGMVIPAQINFVGKGANLFQLGYRFHGSALVISRYLRNSWLWERIRVQGGAYGAFCMFDRLSGALTFVSYRDPNLERTIENFDRTADFLRSLELNEDELSKAIIGTIGDIDRYMLPDTKGYVSMLRKLTGDTDEARQKMRDEVLATSVEHFRAFADVIEQVKEKGFVKVLGSQAAIQEAVTGGRHWLETVKVI